MDIRIFPPEEILETTIELPLSKSISARQLILDYIYGGSDALSPIESLSDSTDTAELRAVLAKGFTAGATIDVGTGGTSARFLTALLAATDGVDVILTASEQMKRRPMRILVDALNVLGADIQYLEEDGFLPLKIRGQKLKGGLIEVDADVSSQFISALMMISPLMVEPLKVRFHGFATSIPYITMTAAMMRRRGVSVEVDASGVEVGVGTYAHANDAEADWSAATFWYEIAALTAGWVTLPNLPDKSLQGDSRVAQLFERLGVLTEHTEDGVELSATPDLYNTLEDDVSDIPDAVPALAITAALAGIPFRLSGVGDLKHKETDRLNALINELAKIGVKATLEAYDTILCWDGSRSPIFERPIFDTYGDHRMAMALAPIAVFIPGIVISGAECVSKSYPRYWEHLASAGFILQDASEPQHQATEE